MPELGVASAVDADVHYRTLAVIGDRDLDGLAVLSMSSRSARVARAFHGYLLEFKTLYSTRSGVEQLPTSRPGCRLDLNPGLKYMHGPRFRGHATFEVIVTIIRDHHTVGWWCTQSRCRRHLCKLCCSVVVEAKRHNAS